MRHYHLISIMIEMMDMEWSYFRERYETDDVYDGVITMFEACYGKTYDQFEQLTGGVLKELDMFIALRNFRGLTP